MLLEAFVMYIFDFRSLTLNVENSGVVVACYKHTVIQPSIYGTVSVDNISDTLIQGSEFGSQSNVCWRQQNCGVTKRD